MIFFLFCCGSAAEFNAPFFLDCCGLIRKVLRDLKEDFGFEIGPWNQAYMVRFNLFDSFLIFKFIVNNL